MNDSSPALPTPIVEIARPGNLNEAVEAAFKDAQAGIGQLDNTVYGVEGFCGRKHRLFVNNLIRRLRNPRYLEIGVFKGATTCAAVWRNQVQVVAVDNWSEYGGPEQESWKNALVFYRNLAACKSPKATVTILEQDFRTAPLAACGPFTVGFYDGSHSEQDQYDGARAVLQVLAPRAVLMIDDWNWDRVRNGTMAAMRDEGVHMELAIELRTTNDGTLVQGPAFGGGSDWHNGIFAAVVTR
jgi:SAM-dependent methyltransferase